MSKTDGLPKLVRDKIPELIRADGKTPVVRQAESAKPLYDKLDEEVREYQESGDFEEIADIYQVLTALMASQHKRTPADMHVLANRKRRERGGFRDGVILVDIKE